MEDILIEIGLNKKEARAYLYLLDTEQLSASELAKNIEETRTNTYMILESLTEMGLVQENNKTTIKLFSAISPQKLQELISGKQKELQSLNASIKMFMPDLVSKYNLAHNKPGVVHREGMQGLHDSLADMLRSKQEVLLVPSDIVDTDKEVFQVLQRAVEKRCKDGIHTRALWHDTARTYPIIQNWKNLKIDMRFIGNQPFDGEVAIYGDNVVFTVYDPKIITTVLTSPVLAATMKQLFELIWKQSKP